MKTIEEMIRYLAREDVAEFAVVSERLPCVKVGKAFQPVDDVAPNTEQILEMLVSIGGSRHVDSLGARPVQWTVRFEGVGMVAVTALMRENVVQARFMIARPAREARPDIDPSARGKVHSAPPPPAAAAALMQAEPQFDLDDRTNITNAPPPASSNSSMPTAGRRVDGMPTAGSRVEGMPTTGSRVDGMRTFEPSSDSAPIELDTSGPASRSAPPSSATAKVVATRPPSTAPLTMRTGADLMGFDDLVSYARGSKGSDLHVVPGRPALIRIAGDLLPIGVELDLAYVERAVAKILPARLRHTLEVEGSCDFAITESAGRARVNISRQRTGPKICVRLIPNEVPTLQSLGLPEQIESATHHHQGLILVTGPTGHGKTSTLAAIVDAINTNTTHHIISVEDPVEYVHPRKRAMMSQREVGAHTKSFANALKASLREDPDVIVVGELRDTETVRMALSASETGHLVIGTMNTQSAAKTIDRLIDLFPPGDQAQVRLALAGGLRLVVSQRLLPNADRTGLVAAAELLPGSVSLWSLIRDNKTYQIPSLQQRGKGLGIIRFDDSLVDLVKSGRTSLEIAKQYAENAEDVELTVLNKKPVAYNPGAPPPPKQPGDAANAAKEAIGGILGKAGNLFRKGG